MNASNLLIIFTRYPEPGNTKTRLIPHLGAEGAAQCQREMTEYTIRQARMVGVQIEIRYTGGSLEDVTNWLGPDLDYAEQGSGDLGKRMERAFSEHFLKAKERVILIGSDCPANNWKNIQQGFLRLDQHDCVIGPASDGGYYLIGLRRNTISPRDCGLVGYSTLFAGIDWGGSAVFDQTLSATSGLAVGLLEELSDVDVPEAIPPCISVIIPTLNEENHLSRTLEKVNEAFRTETIIVDGGSTDKTLQYAAFYYSCTGGRAAQQNFGAAQARGEFLLFLHADTELPDGWDWIIRDTLASPAAVLGAFSFRIKEKVRCRHFIEALTNWRSRNRKLPYGDQGLFMRKVVFDQVGGFRKVPIMEDYDFVRSFRRVGRVVTVPPPVQTSGRRWLRHGVLKVMLINQVMILGYHLGIPPVRLARLYRRNG